MVIFPKVALNEEFSIQSRGFFISIVKILPICYAIYMISRKQILSLLATSLIFICIVNLLSIKGLFYYLFWWFDMPMHFLGGATVLLLLAYLFYNRILALPKIPIILLLTGVLIVGIGWEIFEALLDIFVSHNSQIYFDSSSDLFFDMAGAIVGLLYITRKEPSTRV